MLVTTVQRQINIHVQNTVAPTQLQNMHAEQLNKILKHCPSQHIVHQSWNSGCCRDIQAHILFTNHCNFQCCSHTHLYKCHHSEADAKTKLLFIAESGIVKFYAPRLIKCKNVMEVLNDVVISPTCSISLHVFLCHHETGIQKVRILL